MKKDKVVVLLFCGLAFLIAGCAQTSNKDSKLGVSSALEPQATMKFIDIPVPSGFKLLTQESYAFESSGVRVGVLKYQGKANPDLVSNFYKEQMSLFNWSLINVVEFGDRLISFERENESCIISLAPRGKTVTITVAVGPKSQNRGKPDRAVK